MNYPQYNYIPYIPHYISTPQVSVNNSEPVKSSTRVRHENHPNGVEMPSHASHALLGGSQIPFQHMPQIPKLYTTISSARGIKSFGGSSMVFRSPMPRTCMAWNAILRSVVFDKRSGSGSRVISCRQVIFTKTISRLGIRPWPPAPPAPITTAS